jgi:hypothetical protein
MYPGLHVAEVNIVVGKNYDGPPPDIHNDLVTSVRGGASPLLDLTVVWFPSPYRGIIRIDVEREPISIHFAG